jgi:hypothetical protein
VSALAVVPIKQHQVQFPIGRSRQSGASACILGSARSSGWTSAQVESPGSVQRAVRRSPAVGGQGASAALLEICGFSGGVRDQSGAGESIRTRLHMQSGFRTADDARRAESLLQDFGRRSSTTRSAVSLKTACSCVRPRTASSQRRKGHNTVQHLVRHRIGQK